MITIANLPSHVSYDPETGIFKRMRTYGYRNRYKSGEIIGSIDARGYLILKFDGKQYKAHRVAWALMTGKWPEFEIDHKDGPKNDNRWCNLRPATHAQNVRNRPIGHNNRSGFKGVVRCGRKWRAVVGYEGRKFDLGVFDAPEAAHAAYVAKASELHGEFARAA